MGRKPKDIAGNRYGRLVAKQRTEEKTKMKSANCYIWECVCDCGKVVYKPLDQLESGKVKSCGCLLREFTDITGNIYGKLKVTKYLRTEKYKPIWLCECDCGNTSEVTYSDLASGNTSSCGCSNVKLMQDMYVGGTNVTKVLNPKLKKNNTSGCTGVSYCKQRDTWEAEIIFQGTRYRLGRYKDKNKAIEARKQAEEKLHGEFIEWYNEQYRRK